MRKNPLSSTIDPRDTTQPTHRQTLEEARELIRQKFLPRGWHAVKDLAGPYTPRPDKNPAKGSHYRWRHYVAFFPKKGQDSEEGMLTVSHKAAAEDVAERLNLARAYPSWL